LRSRCLFTYVFASLFLLMFLIPMPVYSQESTSFEVVNAIWGDSGQPLEAGPGSLNVPLSITIVYKEEVPLLWAEVSLDLPRGIVSSTGLSTAKTFVGSLNPGQTTTIVFRMNLDDRLEIGEHTARLTMIMHKSDGKVSQSWVTIPLYVNGVVDLSLEPAGPQTLIPGKRNAINLLLKNQGTGVASEITLSVNAPTGVSLLTPYRMKVGSLGPGETMRVPIEVYLAPSLGGSPITFGFEASYLDAYLYSKTQSFSVGYEVEIPKTPNLILMSSTPSLIQGQLNNILLNITNVGNSGVRDLTVTLSLSSPVVLVGSDGKFYIESLAPGASRAISLNAYITQTTLTSTQLTASLSYIDNNNQLRTESRGLTLSISSSSELLSPLFIGMEPNTLFSGLINNVTVILRNLGSYTLNSITLTPIQDPSRAVWMLEEPITLGSLKRGEESRISARVYVPSNVPPSLPLGMQVTYFGPDNIQKQENREIGVLIKGQYRFEVVDFSILPESPTAGSIFSVTAVIVNTGTSNAHSVSVSPAPVEGIVPFGQARAFLGDLAINTPTSVTFSFRVLNSTRPGVSRIPIMVHFRDSIGDSHDQQLTIPVRIGGQLPQARGQSTGGAPAQTPATSLPSFTSVVMIGSSFVVGVILGMFVRRRRRA